MAGIRLLNVNTLALKVFGGSQAGDPPPTYAIASHVWLERENREVTFQDLNRVHAKDRHNTERFRKEDMGDGWQDDEPSHKKIMNMCEKARSHGIEWLWLDSCCIDKQNNDETQRSINSMYQFYEKADHCYVYFADVSGKTLPAPGGTKPEWLTRGWVSTFVSLYVGEDRSC